MIVDKEPLDDLIERWKRYATSFRAASKVSASAGGTGEEFARYLHGQAIVYEAAARDLESVIKETVAARKGGE